MRTRKRGGAAPTQSIPFYYAMGNKEKIIARAMGKPFIVVGEAFIYDKKEKELKTSEVDPNILETSLQSYDPKEEEKFFYGIKNPRTKKLKNSVGNAWTASGTVGNAARGAGKGVVSVALNPLTSSGKVLGQGSNRVGKHVVKGTSNVLSKATGVRSTYGKLADAIDILIAQAVKIGIEQTHVDVTKKANNNLREFINSVYITRNIAYETPKPLMEAYESAKSLQNEIFVKIKALKTNSRDPTIQSVKSRLDKLVELQEKERDTDPHYDFVTQKFANTSDAIKVFEEKIKLMKDESMVNAYEKLESLIDALPPSTGEANSQVTGL